MSATSPIASPAPSTPTTTVSVSTGARTPDAASLNWQYPPANSAEHSGASTPQVPGNGQGRLVPIPNSPVTVALAAAAAAAPAPSPLTTLSVPVAPRSSSPLALASSSGAPATDKSQVSPSVPLATSPPPSGSTIASLTPTKLAVLTPANAPHLQHTNTPPDSPARSAPETYTLLPQALPPTTAPEVPPKEPLLIAPPRRQSMNPPPGLPISQPSPPQPVQSPRQPQPPPPVPSLPSYIVEINQALATSATLSDVPPLSPVGTTIGSEMNVALTHNPSKPLVQNHPPTPGPTTTPKPTTVAASALPQRSNPPSAITSTPASALGPTKPAPAADPVSSRIWDMCDHSAAVTDGVRVMLEGRGDGAGALAVPKARLVEAVNSISKSRKRVLLYFRLGIGLGPLVDVADYTELLRGLTVLLQEYEAALVAADKTRKRVTKSIMSRFSAATSSSSPKSSTSSSNTSDPFSVSPSFLLTGSYTHLKDFHLPCDISTYHVLQTLLDMIWSLYQFQLSRVDMDQFQGDEVKQQLLEALVRVDSRLQKIIASVSRDVTAVVVRIEEHDRMRKGNKP